MIDPEKEEATDEGHRASARGKPGPEARRLELESRSGNGRGGAVPLRQTVRSSEVASECEAQLDADRPLQPAATPSHTHDQSHPVSRTMGFNRSC